MASMNDVVQWFRESVADDLEARYGADWQSAYRAVREHALPERDKQTGWTIAEWADFVAAQAGHMALGCNVG